MWAGSFFLFSFFSFLSSEPKPTLESEGRKGGWADPDPHPSCPFCLEWCDRRAGTKGSMVLACSEEQGLSGSIQVTALLS